MSDTKASAGYPIMGDTVEGLANYLLRVGKLKTLAHFEPIRRDALAIVRRCRRFDGPDGSETGLVVGYVQSGKTLSMTAVSALARDNGCRLIIVLAGVTNLLLEQNAKRFRDDLRAASGKASAWRIFNSQDNLGQPANELLEQAVADWRDPSLPEADRQTFLYVVLKNHGHLEKLHDVLKGTDLRGISALVIDDEADQAGLNTAPDASAPSTTYKQILSVRAALPHHTYLQYTATPQAPLLIALTDMLSPAFAELVEPGEGYTGGQAFFGAQSRPGLVLPIPGEDLFKPGNPPEDAPESLLEALRVFFVGCAVAEARGGPTPRSMLVHPSPRTLDHTRYLSWITETKKRWASTLRGTDESDKRDTLEEFHSAYTSIQKTDSELPPFESLIQRIQLSLGRVSLKEVNSQDGSEIDWGNANEHILVGGEKLNRGFTVEGLTVTYMPRDAGGWNADTLQQRARFFGYKSSYLSLCRVYLHPEVLAAFRSYVRHEEGVRKQLAEHRGKPLDTWRRAFFLDAKMRPTRRNVLSDPYYKIPRNRLWFVQRHPHSDLDAARRNKDAASALERTLSFRKDAKYFKHVVAEAPLRRVFDLLLMSYQARGGDVASWYGQLVTIADILESSPDSEALIMKMDGPRNRSISGGTVMPHQGKASGGGTYPGDNKMFAPDIVTVQLHTLQVEDINQPILALAVHIPAELRRDDVGASVPE